MPTVLLVDDDPTLLQLYSDVLEEMGCAVSTAPDGQDALSMAPRLLPDLIITDVTMQRMSGLELCQRLRADEQLRGIPRILHSSMDRMAVPQGEVFLRKGGDLSEFTTQVARCLSPGPPRAAAGLRPEHDCQHHA